MEKKLKPKEKRFAEAYIQNGGNASGAARKALGTVDKNVSHVQGSRLLRSVTEKSNLLEKYLPEDHLFTRHREFLDDDKEKTVAAKALDMAYKLKGSYAPEKKEISGQMEMIASDELIALADKLDELE